MTTAIRRFYGRWARLYDAVATAPGVGSWRQRAVSRLELSPGDTVVEMGCGTGANLPYLRDRVGGDGSVVGVDLTPAVLSIAESRAEGWPNVHLVRGDATTSPVDGPVDAVLASFVVGMFDDPGAAIRAWCDLLAPGGRLVLLDAGQSSRSVARPLNAAFRVFVRASAPGGRWGDDEPPHRALDRRIEAARSALGDRARSVGYEEFALGFVRIASGEVS